MGCKWVYTIKYRTDGLKDILKIYGVDYLETFAPIAKMNMVKILLSLAGNYNWDLQQFDVKNVFLHEDLEEKIYMEVRPGFGSKLTIE